MPDWAFKATYANDRTANRDAQDTAVEPHGRWLTRDDGDQVQAEIRLRRRANSRRTYAWLRWPLGENRHAEINVGEVTRRTTRADNLKQAWELAHARGLLEPEGRGQSRRPASKHTTDEDTSS